jgi:hypothetical protein
MMMYQLQRLFSAEWYEVMTKYFKMDSEGKVCDSSQGIILERREFWIGMMAC